MKWRTFLGGWACVMRMPSSGRKASLGLTEQTVRPGPLRRTVLLALEQCHHGFSRADVDTSAFFNIEVGHLAVFYNHCEALAAGAQAEA